MCRAISICGGIAVVHHKDPEEEDENKLSERDGERVFTVHACPKNDLPEKKNLEEVWVLSFFLLGRVDTSVALEELSHGVASSSDSRTNGIRQRRPAKPINSFHVSPIVEEEFGEVNVALARADVQRLTDDEIMNK